MTTDAHYDEFERYHPEAVDTCHLDHSDEHTPDILEQIVQEPSRLVDILDERVRRIRDAAPELLAALKAIAPDAYAGAARDAAFAAIAKATGEDEV